MRILPVGYSHLGKGRSDGIRYVWQLEENRPYIESAAFTTRAKIPTAELDNTISAYTTSVSAGCILTPARMPCRFCRTGNSLRFSGPLSAEEIALQNILMVLSDMENYEQGTVASNLREFAYMGQGEPGFAYPQLRRAIKITNAALHSLGQEVFRHIIATCGVPDMVDAYIDDVRHDFFEGTRTTFHFSLHATEQRDLMMPINVMYNYKEILARLPILHELTQEKPCVGVLLFKNYTHGECKNYTTDLEEIQRVAAVLDPKVCRISLCEYNTCDCAGTNEQVQPEEAQAYVDYLRNAGFEVKLFASFGKQENTACGLLGGTYPDFPTDEALQERYERAKKIIASVSL